MYTSNQGNVTMNPNSQPQQKPDNYLVWAILSTFLCCLPLGAVAIVKSTKVDNLWLSGNHAEAIQASQSAKQWALISAGVGVGINILCFIFFFILGIMGA